MFPDTIKAPGSLTYPGDPAKIFKNKEELEQDDQSYIVA